MNCRCNSFIQRPAHPGRANSEAPRPLDTGATIKEVANAMVEPSALPSYSAVNRQKNGLGSSAGLTVKTGPKSNATESLRKKPGGRGTLHLALKTALLAALVCSASAHAQGILTVTPARSATTAAGTGTIGYTGDNGAATAAALASPGAVAYDGNGNLYIADSNNHVVREVIKLSGNIVTLAGTGIAGFSGDNGPATSAQLDTPTGIAVDATGNIYIADSHNQRIRKLTTGTITTIAGTGSAGFNGDGVATASTLNLPSAIAVDAAGNLYIADTNNQRIRKITGTTISTIAGTGEQNYTGDNAAATAATLDSPTAVAVDTVGNLYIADRHNQRIRMVSATGTITTLAGSGTPNFAGSFTGDGASSTASTLAKPTGVTVDSAGNVTIADTNNQRLRQLGGGVIATVAGNGQQDFSGDTSPATAAALDAPRAVAADSAGNLATADTLNQRIRSAALPTLAFASQSVGIPSTAQTVTLANTGTAAITVATIAFTGAFTTASGGTCSVTPITLTPNASCSQNITFLPIAVIASNGSVVFSGAGVINQTILLTGIGVVASTTTTLSSSVASAVVNQSITFTASVKPAGLGTPTGTVQFYSNAVAIGAPVPLAASGLAALITSFSVSGTYAITAIYSGDPTFTGSTSATLPQTVADFTFALSVTSPGGPAQTVQPGQAATYNFTLTPSSVPFPYPITLSATGLPPGATVTFTPPTVTLGSTPATFTMTIQTAAQTAAIHRTEFLGITVALLILPFGLRLRRRGRRIKPLLAGFLLMASFAVAGLTGCGTGSGFFGQAQQTYTITVTGTATAGNGATLQRSTTVTLTVE
jgi:hypothetical protein